MKPRTIVVAGIATLALAGSLAGVASATTTSSNPSYCVTYGSGPGAAGNNVLYNWDHTACPPNTYRHTITGAQGPAGPAGPAGPSTAGPSGLNVIPVEGTSSTSLEASAVCPPTHPYLVGGGGAIGGGLNGPPMESSFPSTIGASAGWVVQAAAGLAPGTTVFAYALCSK